LIPEIHVSWDQVLFGEEEEERKRRRGRGGEEEEERKGRRGRERPNTRISGGRKELMRERMEGRRRSLRETICPAAWTPLSVLAARIRCTFFWSSAFASDTPPALTIAENSSPSMVLAPLLLWVG